MTTRTREPRPGLAKVVTAIGTTCRKRCPECGRRCSLTPEEHVLPGGAKRGHVHSHRTGPWSRRTGFERWHAWRVVRPRRGEVA